MVLLKFEQFMPNTPLVNNFTWVHTDFYLEMYVIIIIKSLIFIVNVVVLPKSEKVLVLCNGFSFPFSFFPHFFLLPLAPLACSLGIVKMFPYC